MKNTYNPESELVNAYFDKQKAMKEYRSPMIQRIIKKSESDIIEIMNDKIASETQIKGNSIRMIDALLFIKKYTS